MGFSHVMTSDCRGEEAEDTEDDIDDKDDDDERGKIAHIAEHSKPRNAEWPTYSIPIAKL